MSKLRLEADVDRQNPKSRWTIFSQKFYDATFFLNIFSFVLNVAANLFLPIRFFGLIAIIQSGILSNDGPAFRAEKAREKSIKDVSKGKQRSVFFLQLEKMKKYHLGNSLRRFCFAGKVEDSILSPTWSYF